MSKPVPKRAWLTDEGTPRRHRRSRGRRLAVTDGEGSSPRFQASIHPVLLRMVKDSPVVQTFISDCMTCSWNQTCRLHNLRVTY